MLNAFDRLRRTWLAPNCLLCDAVSDNTLSLCVACQQDLPWLLHCCQHCALPLEDKQKVVCLQCQIEPPIFDEAVCALHYSTPVDSLIKRMKFGHQLSCARVLAALLAQHLTQQDITSVDAILPVPLHKSRLRQRGFNQALELAKDLRKVHDIPLLGSVRRVVNTKAQTLVKGEDRAMNLSGAFSLTSGAELPKHVVILDDVITTGSTSNELARLLKEAGVEKVTVWAVARATAHL